MAEDTTAKTQEHDPAEFMDETPLRSAAEEREVAKNWIRTAAQHLRNEEYWRTRAKNAEATREALPGRMRLRAADAETTMDSWCQRSKLSPAYWEKRMAAHERKLAALRAGEPGADKETFLKFVQRVIDDQMHCHAESAADRVLAAFVRPFDGELAAHLEAAADARDAGVRLIMRKHLQ
jgi:hypothetical protein